MAKRPDFFIAGAPKAGTTALYSYLQDHPDICMCSLKEPHYFATDFPRYPRITREDEYLRLFRSCTEEHAAVGEASVWYLYSTEAARNMRAFAPAARIIVMLRNPVDLIHSMHQQALYNFNEDEPDFERAWRLQEARKRGEHIPRGCRAEQILQYGDVGALGTQLRRLLAIFPREQVLSLFFDDLLEDPASVYEATLRFLGVESDGRRDFPRVNAAKTHRLAWLGWLTQVPPRPVVDAARFARRHLGLDVNPLLARLRRLNETACPRPPIPHMLRHELVETFRPEVLLLEELTGRDLSDWRA